MRTVTVPGGRLARWVEGFDRRHGGYRCQCTRQGLSLFGNDGEHAEIMLPYPPWAGSSLDDASTHLTAARRTLVLLVRRGGYACAVVRSELDAAAGPAATVTEARLGRRRVQGRTAAGGWSQQRYARRREKQTAELVAAVAGVAHDLLADVPQRSGPPVWLATGGDRPLIDAVLADPRLRSLAGLPRAVHLAVGDPDRTLVTALPDLLTRVTITLYPPERS